MLIVVVGGIGLVGGLIVYGAIVGAVVVSALWGWFITPTFGIAVPPLPVVAGLSLFAHYVTYQSQSTYKDHSTNGVQDSVVGMLYPWLALFIGWLIHLWAGG